MINIHLLPVPTQAYTCIHIHIAHPSYPKGVCSQQRLPSTATCAGRSAVGAVRQQLSVPFSTAGGCHKANDIRPRSNSPTGHVATSSKVMTSLVF